VSNSARTQNASPAPIRLNRAGTGTADRIKRTRAKTRSKICNMRMHLQLNGLFWERIANLLATTLYRVYRLRVAHQFR